MTQIRVYKERRTRQSAEEYRERRVYCWDVEKCAPEGRAKCQAYIVRENCWDFWPLKVAKYKACCYKRDDCRDCPVVARKFGTEQTAVMLPVYVSQQPPREPAVRAVASRPLLCRNLQYIGGALPEDHSLRTLLREQASEDRDLFRCRLRGVHLHHYYVSDICLSRGATDCVFL